MIDRDGFVERTMKKLVDAGGVASPNARDAANAAFDVMSECLQPTLFEQTAVVDVVDRRGRLSSR